MKPTYRVKVWSDDDWWLAQVVDASDGADGAPLNALTQARSLPKIDAMARDLIATITDADEGTFDVEIVYELPADVDELVCEAKGARAWADAAQELWQERSTVAAKALTEKGYSLRETATLLGLSHQRVDQLLGSHADRDLANSMVYWSTLRSNLDHRPANFSSPEDVQLLIVFRNVLVHGSRSEAHNEHVEALTRSKLWALAEKVSSQLQEHAETELDNADKK